MVKNQAVTVVSTLPLLHMTPSCTEGGALDIVPDVIGILPADAIKILRGIGYILPGRILAYTTLSGMFSEYEIDQDIDCPACSGKKHQIQYLDCSVNCDIGKY
ncbi:MAG: hypothetical protein GY694_13910 [Gammaproteobacteria bacterium]|nr:hypothetical protein [Gammaproteobacteria bacterium]